MLSCRQYVHIAQFIVLGDTHKHTHNKDIGYVCEVRQNSGWRMRTSQCETMSYGKRMKYISI